jgi:hypothetical protein
MGHKQSMWFSKRRANLARNSVTVELIEKRFPAVAAVRHILFDAGSVMPMP